MTDLDEVLRSALHARALHIDPSPDPLRGVDRGARRRRRTRLIASTTAGACTLAGAALLAPALVALNHSQRTAVVPAARPPAAGRPPTSAQLDPGHPWPYRGDPAVLSHGNLPTFRRDWEATHPGSTLTPLFGYLYEPSHRDEVVFVATGGPGPRWGVVTTSEAGSLFLHDQPLTAATSALLAALPGDEVSRLIIVAAPSTGQISYAPVGVTFHPLSSPVPGVAFTALGRDTAHDAVRVRNNATPPATVFQGPAPDAPPRGTPHAIAPPDGPATPTAGICAGPTTATTVTIVLNTDTPNPRCAHLRPMQRLAIRSQLSHATTITVGHRTLSVPAGRTIQIPDAVSSYLAPGHHTIHSPSYNRSGPEILLDPNR